MARAANLRPTFRTLAVPVSLSLAVHGLLLLALWLCPTHGRSPTLAIESTRIALETCLLDVDSSAKGSDELGGPNVKVEPMTFAPVLKDGPLTSPETDPSAAPTLSSGNPPHEAATSSGSPAGGAPSGDGGITGSLFPLPAKAARVVYVLDRSVSMGAQLDRACQELLASLRRLPPAAHFQVIAYNNYVEPLRIDGRIDLLPADPAIIDKVARALDQLAATGGTDHTKALRRGLALHPDVLFFVTDADDLPFDQVESVTRCNRGTVIHAIELTRLRHPRPDSPLAELARRNGGTSRRVWVGD
jgi:hypothetical protein